MEELEQLLVDRTKQLQLQTQRIEKLIATLQSIEKLARQTLDDVAKPTSTS